MAFDQTGVMTSSSAIAQGPPGTGKTTTIARLLIMLANCGQRVLATAPTNVAIAEVAQRCARNRAMHLHAPPVLPRGYALRPRLPTLWCQFDGQHLVQCSIVNVARTLAITCNLTFTLIRTPNPTLTLPLTLTLALTHSGGMQGVEPGRAEAGDAVRGVR